MATTTTARPAASAPRSAWAEYAHDEYGIGCEGMTKAAIIAEIDDLDATDPEDRALVALDGDLDDDEPDDLTDVPEALQFSATIDDDDVDADDDVADLSSIDIKIDGNTFTLSRPSDTALAIRLAEYNAAETVMDQALALLGIISTSLDRTGYVYVRQLLMAPRQEGRRFNENLLANITQTIMDRWGGGEKIKRKADEKRRAANRAARRARAKSRR